MNSSMKSYALISVKTLSYEYKRGSRYFRYRFCLQNNLSRASHCFPTYFESNDRKSPFLPF